MTVGKRKTGAVRIYTIGHSNRSLDDFLALLKRYSIQAVADIRKLPGSRKFPHFNSQSLAEILPENGIDYVRMGELGGLRHPSKGFDSPNKGLENPGFRAYADYMGSAKFREVAAKLVALASKSTTACMCAEAVFWRCHRRLLSDYLVANGAEVLHILSRTSLIAHTITEGAVVTSDGRVVYP